MPEAVAVTLLFSSACPSHEEGLQRLREAARDAGVALRLEVHEVLDDDEAERRRFPGSPTYLIAGADLAPLPEGIPFAAEACRPYSLPDGRIGPLPDRAQLADALRSAAGAERAA